MPGCPSWNGKWSGEDRFYFVTRRVKDDIANTILQQRRYTYAWSDGWRAAVDVREYKILD